MHHPQIRDLIRSATAFTARLAPRLASVQALEFRVDALQDQNYKIQQDHAFDKQDLEKIKRRAVVAGKYIDELEQKLKDVIKEVILLRTRIGGSKIKSR